ncbi:MULTISPECIES: DUF1045 domain-containing protein [unclassified Pseudodesulfovibrio]|uniref:DUF1045 domain-containing protein n=1 Tax=unclassified Pseudodesulfovibrio TaxID=2661612 RepID=UPI0013E36B28|nr:MULTISPECIES: DUF1045 domain-containing protein [unclassified Pseudodesulfovibrio]MCJ2165280.1 DUF1045 domain-containing protein [Pseudodesulfovibrio sp. S3-i]
MPERYAVYYAPEQGSELERFGAAWLGRNPDGKPVAQPSPPGLDHEALSDLTATPRHYGFHGTLVPPMALGGGCTRQEFIGYIEALARTQEPFEMAPLSVRPIGSFLALVPEDQAGLAHLAEAALRALHPFRAPPLSAEKKARRAKGLTGNQERLLEMWGYPYVLEEFRFHVTLTGHVEEEARRAELFDIVTRYAIGVTGRPWPVRELCVFHQHDRQAPFTLMHRSRLGTGRDY